MAQTAAKMILVGVPWMFPDAPGKQLQIDTPVVFRKAINTVFREPNLGFTVRAPGLQFLEHELGFRSPIGGFTNQQFLQVVHEL